MLQKILPKKIWDSIEKNLNYKNIFEIRMRVSRSVCVNFLGEYYYLTEAGLSKYNHNALVCNLSEITDVVNRSCDYSLYAVTKQINSGFITVMGGYRIGICGEIVWNDNCIKTIKNFSAINIRIPHEILNCSKKIMPFILKKDIKNTLLISPPGAGKTTLLRDIARNIAEDERIFNVLIADERSEIAATYNGIPQLNIGNADVISNANKQFAFNQAIRCMRPDVIITDELGEEEDIKTIKDSITCGVKVIASIHGKSYNDILMKPAFNFLIENKLFELYVNISNPPGTISSIYDSNFSRVY